MRTQRMLVSWAKKLTGVSLYTVSLSLSLLREGDREKPTDRTQQGMEQKGLYNIVLFLRLTCPPLHTSLLVSWATINSLPLSLSTLYFSLSH